MKRKRNTSTIRQSPHYGEIVKAYQDRGEKTKYEVFREISALDNSISKSAFYRWTEDREKEVIGLENMMVEDIALEKMEEQIDKRRLVKLSVDLGIKTLQDPELLKDMKPKEILDIAYKGVAIIQAEQELIVGDVHHSEELSYKDKVLNAAAKPDIIIEERTNIGDDREGSEGSSVLREGDVGNGTQQGSDRLADGDDKTRKKA